jgi:hypothetical protein
MLNNTAKNTMTKNYVTLALAAIALCFATACGGGGAKNGGNNAESLSIECDGEIPAMDETVEGFEKFMKKYLPMAEKLAKLEGYQSALTTEMALVMEFQEYTQTYILWMNWLAIQSQSGAFSAEEQARVDKVLELLKVI